MTESRLYTALGLMSGTSMDGVDAAVLRTDGDRSIEPGPRHFIPYPEDFIERLRSILGGQGEIADVERELTDFHATAIAELLDKAGWGPGQIDYIGFHGHTILHAPNQLKTWQIGRADLLAAKFQIPVVYDFRSQDMQAGGQGAPMVPVFHQALAGRLEKPVVMVNIGGVANVTYIPQDGELLAFDTGPGNAMLNDLVSAHAGLPFDRDGYYSGKGKIDQDLLAEWMRNPYFAHRPPKSLDRDHFKEMAAISPDHGKVKIYDRAATLAAFTAHSIAKAAEHFPEIPSLWVITGGGRHNPVLMNMLADALRHYIPNPNVQPIESLGWDGDFIEAFAFAYLAVRSVRGLPLSFPMTTGVKEPMRGGKLFVPQPAHHPAIASL